MLKFQVSSGAPMFDMFLCQLFLKLVHLNLLLLMIKEKITQCTVKTLKLIFSKWPPPHMQPSKTRHIHSIWSRNMIQESKERAELAEL